MDFVKIKNKFWNEFMVPREKADDMVKNRSINFYDISEIEEVKPAIEKSEVTESNKIEVKVESKGVQDVKLNDLTIEELRNEYNSVFWKEIAPRYKNDAEYIKSKLLTK